MGSDARGSGSGFAVLTVSYGDPAGLAGLVASLRQQSESPTAIRVFHNGPRFEPRFETLFAEAGVELSFTGENLGYGAALNRLFARVGGERIVVVNPDVVLDRECLARLRAEFDAHPEAVAVGGALLSGQPGGAAEHVNAYGMRLTLDLLGVNTDRGRPPRDFAAAAALGQGDAGARYLGPSGALFAINRAAWDDAMGGGPLFVEALFLYLEDVALWLKIRRAGGEIRFCPAATGHHAFSESTGQRSGLKLFYVERNRLWLLRALAGRAGAAALLPFSALRMGAYAAASLARTPASGSVGAGLADYLPTLARACREGLFSPLPDELIRYLGPERAPSDLWSYIAPLHEQLRDPTA